MEKQRAQMGALERERRKILRDSGASEDMIEEIRLYDRHI